MKGLPVLVEKASFSKEFVLEFHSGGEGYIYLARVIHGELVYIYAYMYIYIYTRMYVPENTCT